MNDMVKNQEDKAIYLGLAMSGAISAGAYSAGVMDFLIEALHEWEKAKADPGAKVPRHKVVIAGMSGASAGAITSSLGALCAGLGTIPTGPSNDTAIDRNTRMVAGQDAYHVLPDLYDAWVKGPKFVSQPGDPIPGLLDNADVEKILAEYSADRGTLAGIGRQLADTAIKSLLNANGLLDIGDRAMASLATRYAARSGPAPSYVARDLHLFLTQANLRGVPYSVKVLGAGSAEYGMMAHADRAHYHLQDVGSGRFESPWAAMDYAVVSTVTQATADNIWLPGNTRNFLLDTLASGAYPVGLAARELTHATLAYSRRAWTFPVPPGGGYARIQPEWGIKPPADYVHAAVDGGALNNDPIEYARYTLMRDPSAVRPDPSSPDKVDRIVIMISPFPDKPREGGLDHGKAKTDLVTVAKSALSMFVQQSRFKIDELIRAFDATSADLWRISPSRNREGGAPDPYTIACGLYGGFGGFLDIEFRRHDYELGRRNCQDFLRFWFGLPSGNPNIDEVSPMERSRSAPDSQPTLFPIIPLCGTASDPVHVRSWPQITEQAYWAFVDQAASRGKCFIDLAFKIFKLDWAALRWAFDQFTGGGAALVRPYVIKGTCRELVDRKNLRFNDDERKVFDVFTNAKLSRYLIAVNIQRRSPAAPGVPAILAAIGDGDKIYSTGPDELAQLAGQFKISPSLLEEIIDAAPPEWRFTDSVVAELNDPAHFSAGTVQNIVNQLIARGFLAQGDDKWNPEKNEWAGWFGTKVPVYRFIGNSAKSKFCA